MLLSTGRSYPLVLARAACAIRGLGVTLAFNAANRTIAIHPGQVTLEAAQQKQSRESLENFGPVARVEFQTH